MGIVLLCFIGIQSSIPLDFTVLLNLSLELTGEQREIPSQGRKNPISVSIGGVRCPVESQYISNEDFLEVSPGLIFLWKYVVSQLSLIYFSL